MSLSLSLLLSIINCFQPPHYPCIGSIITWNINRLSSALRSKKGSPLWMEKQTSTGRESAFGRAIRFNSRFMFSWKRLFSQSLQPVCSSTFSMSYTPRVNHWQNWLHRLMETSSKAVESSWDREITSIYLTPKIQDLKYQVHMYRCADEKISKTENKVTVANCDVEVVENLDHQNWQLLKGKSYITSISINKQKIS